MLFEDVLKKILMMIAMLRIVPNLAQIMMDEQQCPGNILASDESINYYVRSIKYMQQSVQLENLSGLRAGSGLGLSWVKTPLDDINYSIQIRFKFVLTICCIR